MTHPLDGVDLPLTMVQILTYNEDMSVTAHMWHLNDDGLAAVRDMLGPPMAESMADAGHMEKAYEAALPGVSYYIPEDK